MKKQSIVLALAFVLLFSFSGAMAAISGLVPNTPALKKKVEQFCVEMEAAYKAGDMLKVASFYADDASMMLPDGRKIQGRKAINEYWAGIKGAKDLQMQLVEVGGMNDMIYHVGKMTMTYEENGQPVTQTSDFVMLWKKQPNWDYKVYVSSSN